MKHILGIIMLLGTSNVFSQSKDTLENSKYTVKEVYGFAGSMASRMSWGSLQDFKTLAPQSQVLNQDFSEYENDRWRNQTSFGPFFSFGMELKKASSRRRVPRIRIGVSYFHTSFLSYGLKNEVRERIDTLVSTSTGSVAYLDSIKNQWFEMNKETENIALDLAFIYRTEKYERWSFYAGFGIISAVSLQSNTTAYHYRFFSTELVTDKTSTFSNNPVFYNSAEYNENKTVFSAFAYIPIGIGVRLSKKRKILNQLYLNYEIRPSIYTAFIPELRAVTNWSIQKGVVLRYVI